MKKHIIFVGILLLFCSASKPEKIDSPDAGFKYKIKFEKQKSTGVDISLANEKLTHGSNSKLIAGLAKMDINNRQVSPFSIDRACYFFISDAYTCIDEETNAFDRVRVPPKFKGGDEAKFCKWIKKNYKFDYFNSSMILSDANRGNLIFNITIDRYGNLSDIKPLTVDDSSLDQEIFNGFFNLLERSPKWKPAKENGQEVESNYIIALVWGHFRLIDDDLDDPKNANYKLYQQALEEGWDPLYIMID